MDFAHMLSARTEPNLYPTLFIGHGSPMNAIEDNEYSQSWEELGKALPKPKAILCISAHWMTQGVTNVHVSQRPKMIYDMYGFPDELYTIQYPCLGAPDVAEKLIKKVTSTPVTADTEWGLDHGAWSVLVHLFPKADIPVLELSIDMKQPLSYHYNLGKELAYLRSEGVLVIGSGNIVHNLWRIDPQHPGFPWATQFDTWVADRLLAGDDAALVSPLSIGEFAHLAIPTPDHYIPFLYILGARFPHETPQTVIEGIALGSISMRSVLF